MKKQIKVKFLGFWPSFLEKDNIFLKILREKYDCIISNDDADYIVCSVFCDENMDYYTYCNYPQIRIMISGENYIPDFNFIDYGISSYQIKYLDRHFYLPFALFSTRAEELSKKKRVYDSSLLSEKRYFANFISGHESENNIRGDFFKKLSRYKRVESPGRFLNNMEDNFVVDFRDDSKIKFQRECKFTICFESTKHEGFITEKIIDAFLADTIPIYYGSTTVNQIFNEKAFINCNSFNSFDEVIEKVIELDNNDDEYLEMLCQPIFLSDSYYSNLNKELESFICNIFDQSKTDAYRRSLVYSPKEHEKYICGLQKIKSYKMSLELLSDKSVKQLAHAIFVKVCAKFRLICRRGKKH